MLVREQNVRAVSLGRCHGNRSCRARRVQHVLNVSECVSGGKNASVCGYALGRSTDPHHSRSSLAVSCTAPWDHAITCTTPHRNNRVNFSIAFHQWMFMQSRAALSSLIKKQKIYLLNIVTLLSISGSLRRAAPNSLISIKLF
ncbi:uncharacterized protein LOC143899327 [Temnothorax americanus]|uniref:uncharacterized protein LOC143899327 n=1 Tax=Temnothorax americanus TaxID=1964332 RepID=UPI004067C227